MTRALPAFALSSLLSACAMAHHAGEESDPPDCPLGGDVPHDPSAAYPFCQWESHDGWAVFCPRFPTVHGYWNWHADGASSSSYCEGGSDCNACVCSHPCTADAECPEPPTGTSTPACLGPPGGESCFLACGELDTCPDGMRCVHNLELERLVCAWVSEGDRCAPQADGRWGP